MAKSGKARLRLQDVFGEPIQELVTIQFFHQTLVSENKMIKAADASKNLDVTGLQRAPLGLYRIAIDPPSYLPVGRFVDIPASGSTAIDIQFPVDPEKVTPNFQAYEELADEVQTLLSNSTSVLNFAGQSGKTLYDNLDPIRKAGFLNIAAKSSVTPLANETTVLPRIDEVYELRGDRFFAKVSKEFREDVKNSVSGGLFSEVSGSLHHPPEGFTSAGSFKTPDAYGNLQLTFFMNGDDCRVDVDIDDAQGLGHVFQVLRNALTGRPTHPYDIHQILYVHQHIDAGYRFTV